MIDFYRLWIDNDCTEVSVRVVAERLLSVLFVGLFLYPVIAALLNFLSQVRTGGTYDAPVVKHVDDVRLYHVEQTLIVGDDDDRLFWREKFVDTLTDDAHRVDIKTRSVSSRMESCGSSIAIWNISLRFFSPPEKPSLTERCVSFESSSTSWRFSRISFMNSGAFSGSSPWYLRFALTAAFMKFVILTPGISTGYWKLRNIPS